MASPHDAEPLPFFYGSFMAIAEADLTKLRRIGAIDAETIQAMADHLKPAITTGELDAIGQANLMKYGARSAPQLIYNFPGATCISVNHRAAHGIPGELEIAEGD